MSMAFRFNGWKHKRSNGGGGIHPPCGIRSPLVSLQLVALTFMLRGGRYGLSAMLEPSRSNPRAILFMAAAPRCAGATAAERQRAI